MGKKEKPENSITELAKTIHSSMATNPNEWTVKESEQHELFDTYQNKCLGIEYNTLTSTFVVFATDTSIKHTVYISRSGNVEAYDIIKQSIMDFDDIGENKKASILEGIIKDKSKCN